MNRAEAARLTRVEPDRAAVAREQQYVHLVRLAWDLRVLGLRTMIDLPATEEPTVLVQRGSTRLRVMVLTQGQSWYFTWGRSWDQRAEVLDTRVPERIARAVSR